MDVSNGSENVCVCVWVQIHLPVMLERTERYKMEMRQTEAGGHLLLVVLICHLMLLLRYLSSLLAP